MLHVRGYHGNAGRSPTSNIIEDSCIGPRGGSRICGKGGGGAQRRSRLKTLFGISKGGAQGACALFGPP